MRFRVISEFSTKVIIIVRKCRARGMEFNMSKQVNPVHVCVTPIDSSCVYTDVSTLALYDRQEYFLSEDVGEVLRSIKELESPAYHYELVKRAINMSLDARDHEVCFFLPASMFCIQ